MSTDPEEPQHAASEQPQTARISYREALRMALREELARDERVFLMGEEIGIFEGAYKVTAGLLAEIGGIAGVAGLT